ncbi:MAG TPA: M1 family metallopeptidase [Bacteroidia bacterium]|nr:M1 family metallopeptidase [Bacteroidia bacterium]
MMYRIIILMTVCFSFSMELIIGQTYDPNHPPNQYRSDINPYYWKNRKPYSGYWQQDVYYKIDANIDDKTNITNASMTLVYWNNSPDTLDEIFFHLYQNAFQPGSYYDDLHRNNKIKPIYGPYENKGLGTTINKLDLNTSNNYSYSPEIEYDNTIAKINLKHGLLPGDSLTFIIDFTTYFDAGSVRRRMKVFNTFGNKHYDGVHWYPKICVYDHKFGWHTSQHLGKEYYSNFGTYDVKLTFSNHFIVDATGTLQNKEEVMPDALRQKLDIKNFADKPYNSAPSLIIVPDGTVKTWHYYAENVHNFAFTADPTYRIGEHWATLPDQPNKKIECIALVQEPHSSRWQNAAEYASKIIEVLSQDIGEYAYPKIIVADARDGMEYPMLTLDGGYDPNYRDLFAHEIGHMWFYAMVGNNETYSALLDEGFTQFLNALALDRIEGPYGLPVEYSDAYTAKHTIRNNNMYNETHIYYLTEAIKNTDGIITTHSNMFNGALHHGGGYRQVYRKAGTMLYNLQYVLGDSLFSAAMKNYFNQWKFCHPYVEDFRNSIIQFTKIDLNWFFDQWLNTDKNIDYKISSVRKVKGNDRYRIKLKRKGRMYMPLDLTAYNREGIAFNFYIPNTRFVKKSNAKVLPKWEAWDKLSPTYETEIEVPGGLKKIIIDTTYRLADVNLLNNAKPTPYKLRLEAGVRNVPQWDAMQLRVRPDIWYNGYDGIKAGVHVNGDYLNYLHKFSLSIWGNTGIGQQIISDNIIANEHDVASFILNYQLPLKNLFNQSELHLSARSLDGLQSGAIRLNTFSRDGKTIYYSELSAMIRNNQNDVNYLLYPSEWRAGLYNNNLSIGFKHFYSGDKLRGNAHVGIRSSSAYSDFNHTYATLESTNSFSLLKFEFNTRGIVVYGSGNNPAPESMLYTAGANPEEMMDNKYVRSYGMVPEQWLGYGIESNHFHHGGGLNLRGYSGYVVAEENSEDDIQFLYKSTSGAAFNIEIDFDRYIPLKPSFTRNWLKFDTYLFADGGVINKARPGGNLLLSAFRMDAGAGIAMTIKHFGPLDKAKPLTIRFDVPVFLNRAPAADEDYFGFRYVVGINRAF